jgi:hypothetical protein
MRDDDGQTFFPRYSVAAMNTPTNGSENPHYMDAATAVSLCDANALAGEGYQD